jgi:hypothetical protein
MTSRMIGLPSSKMRASYIISIGASQACAAKRGPAVGGLQFTVRRTETFFVAHRANGRLNALRWPRPFALPLRSSSFRAAWARHRYPRAIRFHAEGCRYGARSAILALAL